MEEAGWAHHSVEAALINPPPSPLCKGGYDLGVGGTTGI